MIKMGVDAEDDQLYADDGDHQYQSEEMSDEGNQEDAPSEGGRQEDDSASDDVPELAPQEDDMQDENQLDQEEIQRRIREIDQEMKGKLLELKNMMKKKGLNEAA